MTTDGFLNAPPEPCDMRQGFPIKVATGYALAALGLPVVERRALRALLPRGVTKHFGEQQFRTKRAKGDGSSGKNQTTIKFQDALRAYEKAGWVQRGELFVRVSDARALLDFTAPRLPDPIPPRFLDWGAAVAELREKDARISVEVRRSQLMAFQRMMEEGFGPRHSGRGAVQAVNKSRTL